jgi:hypothetical protein
MRPARRNQPEFRFELEPESGVITRLSRLIALV